jgi:hypothetical protein
MEPIQFNAMPDWGNEANGQFGQEKQPEIP